MHARKLTHELRENRAAVRRKRVVHRRTHTARFTMTQQAKQLVLLSFGDKLRVKRRVR